MPKLYPSWIEIPVEDLERALGFYRSVFGLEDAPIHDDGLPMRVAVLLPSDKRVGNPGVSLVQSPRHTPSTGGVQINFHLGDHATFAEAIGQVASSGGAVESEVVDEGEGVLYVIIRDSEGNTLALSGYQQGLP